MRFLTLNDNNGGDKFPFFHHQLTYAASGAEKNVFTSDSEIKTGDVSHRIDLKVHQSRVYLEVDHETWVALIRRN